MLALDVEAAVMVIDLFDSGHTAEKLPAGYKNQSNTKCSTHIWMWVHAKKLIVDICVQAAHFAGMPFCTYSPYFCQR